MSKSEYQEFTPAELAFIRKEWENAVVFDSTITRDAVLNATYNANRKKGKRFRKLWTKLGKITRTEKKTYEDTKKRILEMEKENPTNWVQKIYEANGWRLNKKGGTTNG